VSYLLVALGGALGATARFIVAGLVHRVASPFFPWGTFAINVTGCFVFGLIAGIADARGAIGPATRAFVLVGILGGYTTFSSFAFETFELLRAGQVPAAIGNTVGQVVLGLTAFWVGWVLTRTMLGVRP
jgi:fluoride exporter